MLQSLLLALAANYTEERDREKANSAFVSISVVTQNKEWPYS